MMSATVFLAIDPKPFNVVFSQWAADERPQEKRNQGYSKNFRFALPERSDS